MEVLVMGGERVLVSRNVTQLLKDNDMWNNTVGAREVLVAGGAGGRGRVSVHEGRGRVSVNVACAREVLVTGVE